MLLTCATVALTMSIPTAGSTQLVWIAPHVQNVTRNSATFVWATNRPAPGTVDVFAANGEKRRVTGHAEQLPAGRWLYTASIDGLQGCYKYRVQAGGSVITTGDPLFCTAPPPGTDFSFAAFGDSGTGLKSQANLAAQLLRDYQDATPLAFIAHVGDLAYPKGEYEQFASVYFAVYKELFQHIPVFATAGNHEYYTDNGNPYRKLNVLPVNGIPAQDAEKYYSFDWGDVHFVSFDSNPGSPVTTSRFQDWLQRDLAASKARWKIVFFHVAAISSGSHGSSATTKALIPILERNGVDLVLQGHDHNIQRTVPMWQGRPAQAGERGITYVVTGAGSQASYSCQAASWLAYKLCGSSIPVYTRVTVTRDELIVEQVRDTGAVLDRAVIPYRSR